MELRLRDRRLSLTAGEPLVMGILNIGLDSVADASRFADRASQVARGLELVAAGADLIDVGVLSGRTDTEAVPVAEEIGRLVPVVSELAAAGVLVSVDTWRAETAAAALDAGAALINDTSGLRDPSIASLAAASGAALVVMHTRVEPKRRLFPAYDDPMADVIGLLRERVALAVECGVDFEQIVVDPGLDYAKTPQDSVSILRRLPELSELERPVLLAVSRKYFIGMLTGAAPDRRLAGTLAAVEFGVSLGAHLVRVHDVADVVEYLQVRAALVGTGEPVMRGSGDDDSLKWLPPKVG